MTEPKYRVTTPTGKHSKPLTAAQIRRAVELGKFETEWVVEVPTGSVTVQRFLNPPVSPPQLPVPETTGLSTTAKVTAASVIGCVVLAIAVNLPSGDQSSDSNKIVVESTNLGKSAESRKPESNAEEEEPAIEQKQRVKLTREMGVQFVDGVNALLVFVEPQVRVELVEIDSKQMTFAVVGRDGNNSLFACYPGAEGVGSVMWVLSGKALTGEASEILKMFNRSKNVMLCCGYTLARIRGFDIEVEQIATANFNEAMTSMAAEESFSQDIGELRFGAARMVGNFMYYFEVR